MIREIHPLNKPVNASILVPGSKSLTNRALICAALAKGESAIINASDSDDTALMQNGLNQLGVLVRKNSDALIVEGTGGKVYSPKFPIPVGNAGTTLRFLLSLAALAQGETVLQANDRMAERPIDDLRKSLATLGAVVEFSAHQARYVVRGGSFVGGRTKLDASKSSQFLSSLLMVAPYATRDVEIEVAGEISSVSYVQLTMQVMREFGLDVEELVGKVFRIRARQRYLPTSFTVEADASSATYFLAAGALCGGEIFVDGVGRDSLQADATFADILQQMGCTIEHEARGIRLKSNGRLQGVDVSMNTMPDAVPTVVVTALFAKGATRIRNISHLRHKESDRLQAMETELKKLGADIAVHDDWMEINPTTLSGALLDTYDDHRLVMAFALIGLKIDGVKIENPACVKKSFPQFWTEFDKLYA
ncbi:MAG: 3-phosphoshikimate 1-carboxyvinyltransferase [Bacteroidetes bacterium]|nr:3-phosphoshikimate 1-carboxyvinyltransferase [Bacteroidota bacterium]MCW5894475.1 3-phosphoshikimate 1-carboxyvinyltransferase [Bacteroidota bacterium]